MQEKGWWAQHSFKGLAKSMGSFVEGVTGGESLQTQDAKEEQDLVDLQVVKVHKVGKDLQVEQVVKDHKVALD